MKVQIDDDGKKAIMQIVKQVLQARKYQVMGHCLVNVLEEIGSTGARIFIKTALDILKEWEFIDENKKIAELIDEM